MQPSEPQPEEPGDSREPSVEPSSEPRLDQQSEPTVTFLLTLLNTPEPKDAESDMEALENRFLSQEDWGPRRTSREIQNLQRDCKRLQEALNTNQRDNLILEEELQDLPTSVYENLEGTLLTPKDLRDIQEAADGSRGNAGNSQQEALVPGQRRRVSAQRYSLERPVPLLTAIPLPEDGVSQEQQSALARPEAREWKPPQDVPAVCPSLNPSNKDPH